MGKAEVIKTLLASAAQREGKAKAELSQYGTPLDCRIVRQIRVKHKVQDAIIDAFVAGATLADIARAVCLSAQRVSALVKDECRRRNICYRDFVRCTQSLEDWEIDDKVRAMFR